MHNPSVTATLPLRSTAMYACLASSLNAKAPAPATKTTVAAMATLRRSLYNCDSCIRWRHACFPACEDALEVWVNVRDLNGGER